MSTPGEKRPLGGRLAATLVRAYQLTLSPLQRLLGPGAGCRFHPSCSEYARLALLEHGLWTGLRLATARLLRCHPFHPGGYDPVPRKYTPHRAWFPQSGPKTHG